MLYLNIAIFLCKITGTEPSFLLHPLDIIGGDQIKSLAFFPGMNITSDRKIYIFKKVIRKLAEHYTLVNMRDHVFSIKDSENLKTIPIPVS